MRLELNLPALERLIAGDTEMELALRKQIVQEFAKRHLKEVAEQATYKVAVEETQRLVNETAREAFGVENLVSNHLWPTVTVGSRLKSLIDEMVKERAQRAVDEALSHIIKWQKSDMARCVHVAVEKAMQAEINKLVETEIQRRLTLAKDAK